MDLDLPSSFQEAVRERRIIPFIGAGFSKNIDSSLPNWSEVIHRAAELLDYDPPILTAQGDQYQIAEYLQIKKQLGGLYNVLAKEFERDDLDVAKSKPHLLLPYLDVPFIFTTNWDAWIEKGFEHEGISYAKIITHDDFVSPRTYRPKPGKPGGSPKSPLYPKGKFGAIRQKFKDTTIVKYHGDFSDHQSIVFQESHYYDRLDFEHPLDIKLRSEIIGRSVLFMGYSFSDTNVRYIWHKLKKLVKTIDPENKIRSFFVTHLNNPLLIEVFRTKNIDTILLPPKDLTTHLSGLLEYMIEQQMS